MGNSTYREIKKSLLQLSVGQEFRYIGSDTNDWHSVTDKTEDKITYTSGFGTDTNTSMKVKVWLKVKRKPGDRT